MGTRCGVSNPKSVAVPATVSGELFSHKSLGNWEDGNTALTRKPGDLPSELFSRAHRAGDPGEDRHLSYGWHLNVRDDSVVNDHKD